jgi:hypothetical protein
MSRPEFTISIQKSALGRQNNRCASCGEIIWCLGEEGREDHFYGEIAHAHHMKPCQLGGTNQFSNCVIICESCHYSAHGGGDYRNKDYFGRRSNFPYYEGEPKKKPKVKVPRMMRR